MNWPKRSSSMTTLNDKVVMARSMNVVLFLKNAIPFATVKDHFMTTATIVWNTDFFWITAVFKRFNVPEYYTSQWNMIDSSTVLYVNFS